MAEAVDCNGGTKPIKDLKHKNSWNSWDITVSTIVGFGILGLALCGTYYKEQPETANRAGDSISQVVKKTINHAIYQKFSEYDLNQDGKINRNELLNAYSALEQTCQPIEKICYE